VGGYYGTEYYKAPQQKPITPSCSPLPFFFFLGVWKIKVGQTNNFFEPSTHPLHTHTRAQPSLLYIRTKGRTKYNVTEKKKKKPIKKKDVNRNSRYLFCRLKNVYKSITAFIISPGAKKTKMAVPFYFFFI
jgi:hypothetical protein